MAAYTRRDHFAAALLMISTIEIIGLLSHRFFLSTYQTFIATVTAVVLVGIVFYRVLYRFPAIFTAAIILALVNLFLFFRSVYAVSRWNSCKGFEGIFAPDIVCGFKYMMKYYFPGLVVRPYYLTWFISELAVVTLLLSYWIAGRRLGLK